MVNEQEALMDTVDQAVPEAIDIPELPDIGGMDLVVLDIETVCYGWTPPKEEPDRFPPMWAWRVVCIGIMQLAANYHPKYLGSLVGSEPDILQELSSLMSNKPRLITFNGRRFDLPALQMAYLRNGMSMEWLSGDYRYRYGEKHVDVYDQLSMFGACSPGTLDGMLTSMGFPGKQEVDGSQVGDMYARGEIVKISDYCKSDVAQTAILAMYLEVVKGRIKPGFLNRKVAAAMEMWKPIAS